MAVLPTPGFADEHGVVLRLAREELRMVRRIFVVAGPITGGRSLPLRAWATRSMPFYFSKSVVSGLGIFPVVTRWLPRTLAQRLSMDRLSRRSRPKLLK